MKCNVSVFLLFLMAFPSAVLAQQSSARPSLTDGQKEGRRILQQKCAVCHVPAGASAKTLGTGLSKMSLGGDPAALRETIMNGLGTSMPGFKYILTPAQVGDIIDFIKTLDSPARTLASERPER